MAGMKPLVLLALATLPWISLGFQEGPSKAGQPSKERRTEDLGAMFQHHCGHCHVPPDVAFEVDRAWLNQVHDTA